MKKLQSALSESLQVNESIVKILAIVDYENPETINLVRNYTKDTLKMLQKTDMNVFEFTADQNVCYLMWNNGDAYLQSVASNFAQFKQYVTKNAIDSVEREEGDDNEEVGEVDFGVTTIYSEEKRKDFFKNPWITFADFIKNSEVDGDSAYGYAVIDVNQKKVLVKGLDDVQFMDEKTAQDLYGWV